MFPLFTLALLFVAALTGCAGGIPAAKSAPQTLAVAPAVSASPNQQAIDRAVNSYYAIPPVGIQRLTIKQVDILPPSQSGRYVAKVTLDVVPDSSEPGVWIPGTNTRWVEVRLQGQSWQVTQEAAGPLGP